MDKTCVFITGTHAVGKSELARAIIDRFGGIARYENGVTYCAAGSVCLAGKYEGARFGGVDRLQNDKGSSCTSVLASTVEEGLRNADIIVCEGSFMNTFGMNLTNAMFKAQRYLLVSLFCPPQILYERLKERSSGKNGKRNIELIFKKQRQAMIAARKWQSIGVKVLQIDTSKVTVFEELRMVIDEIQRLCGG